MIGTPAFMSIRVTASGGMIGCVIICCAYIDIWTCSSCMISVSEYFGFSTGAQFHLRRDLRSSSSVTPFWSMYGLNSSCSSLRLMNLWNASILRSTASIAVLLDASV